MPARTRVLVADDHPMYRHGLVDTIRRRPELELVGTAEEGRDALARIKELAPDVALLDVQMPGLGGLDVLRAIERDGLPAKVLFVSAFFDSEIVYAALAGGAAGYLSKDSSGGQICDSIAAIARGQTVLGPEVQIALAREIRRRSPDGEAALLTPREREILSLTANGLGASEIAGRLHLGTTTVKTHLQRAYEKLGVSDRAAAVAEAMRRGLLE
jgi:two-component system, NarL family, nitrate/nitrite response regulator NarL